MSTEMSIDTKVYPTGDGTKLSMTDMLDYFQKHGALRVSDLHIKVGAVPAYRIDGDTYSTPFPVLPRMVPMINPAVHPAH